MADRSIVVRIGADVTGLKRGMTEAASAISGVDAAARPTNTTLGRLAQSARDNRAAWTTTGTALAAFGAVIVGVGVAALKTGISYNTLQQQSRAALTTLLGSAQAANAQMDKLDVFARTSPFAKQVFISAQQQMIGFGIATQKVIPYLDAMQNAVAAMGGSNDDVAELTRIMSQISASSKITATDLMEFGRRGIDAATLIGSQMGKTGAQIREDITAGTLDAQVALDALAAGMQARFGGAAANVKETMVGALDRVKAAWRDFSGMITEPLVDPNGGGALVGLLNNSADLMRAFMGMSEPIRNVSLGVVGLTGVVSLLAGGFMVMAPRILDTVDALKTMHLWTKNVGIGVGVAAGALTAATIVLSVYAGELARTKAMQESFAATLNDTAGVTGDTSAEIRDLLAETRSIAFLNFDSAYTEAEKMGIGFNDLTNYVLGNADAIDTVNAAGDKFIEGSSYWEHQIQSREGAVSNLTYTLDTMAGSLTEAQRTELLKIQADEAAGVAQGDLAADYDVTTDSISAQIPTLEDLIGLQATAAGVVLSERDAQRAFQSAIDDATAALETNGQTLDITTEAGRANQAALDAIAKSGWDVQTSMQAAEATQPELQAAMQVSRDTFVAMAVAEGASADEANRLADEVGLIPAKVGVTVSVDTTAAEQRLAAFKALLNIPDVVVTATMRATNPYYASGLHGATGGAIYGPGTGTSDSVLSHLSTGEHVLTANEVGMAGGQAAVYRMRAAIRAGVLRGFRDGGAVQGYAGGGSVYAQRQYAGTPQWSGGSAGAGSRTVEVTQNITVTDPLGAAVAAARRLVELGA